ncbi:hypothetical protein [Aurantiacibacter poecillastricola]|uniref:hypothetical protein n=1 Tax=Aurantiacibacter poecillastricola TaxID=3064385 RepID=UPI0027402B5D|nr:hypothetical protein [Aurantiacibacter sp. 219JJ12-13]MDP5261093.1 hypothetical protein [Aurantiacibacter sp. 219JJ12-13]
MTTGQGTAAPPARGEDFASAWRELRRDEDIQFAPVNLPEQEEQPPDWLTRFLEWLGELFAPLLRLLVESWPVLSWVLLGLAVLLAAWFLFRTFGPKPRGKASGTGTEESWAPEQHEALALLEEADRLAAAGNFDEATHLLLKRSVAQIAEARPGLVEPSSTARELAAEPRLPEAARAAFALIAAPVERSLFALGHLDEGDWQAARAAYADFARVESSLSRSAAAA